jgi:arabinofuranosyltransferase
MKFLPLLVVGAAVTIAAALTAYSAWFNDDAIIALVYARNLVNGAGLVFNRGEYVEGYTCFLWVLLGALGIRLGVDPRIWLHLLGGASFVALVVGVYALGLALAPRQRWSAALASLAVAIYPPMACWSGSGMETGLFAALLVWSAWFHVRGSVLAPLFLVLLSWTRPEGWLFAGLCCADALWRDRRRGVPYIVAYAVPMLAWFGWRVWYYGDWLPNTFYAKVGGGFAAVPRGLHYLGTFLRAGGGGVFAAAFAVGAVLSFRRAPAVVAFVALSVLYTVYVGGDVFALHRFYVPLIPLMMVLCVPSRRAMTVLVAAEAAAVVLLWNTMATEVASARAATRIIDALGSSISGRIGPGDVVASVGIGAVKWYTGATVVDVVGLTDRVVASTDHGQMGTGIPGHERSNADYVFARRPKYLLIPQEGYSIPLPALVDIWKHPELEIAYRKCDLGYERLPEPVVEHRRQKATRVSPSLPTLPRRGPGGG